MLWYSRFYTTGGREYEWRHKVSHANHTRCILLILYYIILYYSMTARFSCFKSVLIRAIELRIAVFQQVASPYLIHNWCQCIRVYIHIRIHSFQEYTQTRENKDYLRIRLHLRNYNNVIIYILLKTNTFSILQICLHLFIYLHKQRI